MSEATTIPNPPDKPTPADAAPSVKFDWGVGPLLNAQADMLAGAEAAVGDWLRRRHEAVADTQQLIARMSAHPDPMDALKAQREWMSRSFRRLAADADACHSAAQYLLDGSQSWFPNGGWIWPPRGVAATETPASQAAATRAAARPLRMANKAD
jgi:hypothetical protein